MMNTQGGDLELERRSPLWGPGTRIILLTPLYYLDLYTTNICLRCLNLALVHASKAELGLLVFTVAQKSVPMFACLSLKSITPNCI